MWRNHGAAIVAIAAVLPNSMPFPTLLLSLLLSLLLLQLLPADVERIALPRCLTSIAGLLRSRLHSSRDAAREVLTDLALELGPEYLPTIIK